MKKAYYLKINRTDALAIQNLSCWMDTAFLANADCYIVCDKEDLTEKIKDSLLLSVKTRFIKSQRSGVLKEIVDNLALQSWSNAAYAHLTTFLHAQENAYDYFWNIDADDTQFCLSLDRLQELLHCAEEYAQSHDFDCFSLDMWHSHSLGVHWSFGITYTKVRMDWMEVLNANSAECTEMVATIDTWNLDWYFTYLRSQTSLKLETFYVDNLRFIHYSPEFFVKVAYHNFFHWKKGKLILSIMCNILDMEEVGLYEIPSDTIKLNFQIQDEEISGLCGLSVEPHASVPVNATIRNIKHQLYVDRYVSKKHVICFGAGACFRSYYRRLQQYFDIRFVCDNNPDLWGKEIVPGITCISPTQLYQMQDIYVMITVYYDGLLHLPISNQLAAYNSHGSLFCSP